MGAAAGERPAAPQQAGFLFAHLSDPHLSDLSHVKPTDLLNKRLLGYLSWRAHRRNEHRSEVLSALLQDLRRQDPGHVVVTGDLTHLGLPEEFREVARWLPQLGTPDDVTIIPGNHETYVQTPWEDTLTCWLPYMLSDGAAHPDREGVFPSLRIRGGVAFVGVSSARPSLPFLAVGSLGAVQLQALDALLGDIAGKGLFRVLLIHHPPLQATLGRRKHLTDGRALREVLRHRGVDLVLHGHSHRQTSGWLPTTSGPAPVLGVPSASAIGLKPGRRARYNLCRIIPRADGWDLSVEARGYSGESGEFVAAGRISTDAPEHYQR